MFGSVYRLSMDGGWRRDNAKLDIVGKGSPPGSGGLVAGVKNNLVGLVDLQRALERHVMDE
jgi:hypothetical protein